MKNVKINKNAENVGVVHTHTHTQVRLERLLYIALQTG